MPKTIGPVTVEVGPPRAAEEGGLGVSATYRNIAAVDGLPATFEGASTLYELFNQTVEQYGENRCGWEGGEGGVGAPPPRRTQLWRRGAVGGS